MIQSVQEFKQRMRHDRAFRQNILAARKAGTLGSVLEQECCEFDLDLLAGHLPQVRTGLLAGADENTTSCFCAIIS